jgi:hypothetical protein
VDPVFFEEKDRIWIFLTEYRVLEIKIQRRTLSPDADGRTHALAQIGAGSPLSKKRAVKKKIRHTNYARNDQKMSV